MLVVVFYQGCHLVGLEGPTALPRIYDFNSFPVNRTLETLLLLQKQLIYRVRAPLPKITKTPPKIYWNDGIVFYHCWWAFLCMFIQLTMCSAVRVAAFATRLGGKLNDSPCASVVRLPLRLHLEFIYHELISCLNQYFIRTDSHQ